MKVILNKKKTPHTDSVQLQTCGVLNLFPTTFQWLEHRKASHRYAGNKPSGSLPLNKTTVIYRDDDVISVNV